VIQYEVERPIEGLIVGIRIWNPMNVPVMTSEMKDKDLEHRGLTMGRPGRSVVSVDIPAHLLGPGQYLLEVGIWSPHVDTHHHAPRALTFQVLSAAEVQAPVQQQKTSLSWRLL